MPAVSFVYTEEAQAKWDAYKRRQQRDKEIATIPETGETLDELSFEYDIEGEAPWKPIRVYNDGVRTTLDMPDSMAQSEAPTLLVVRQEGGLFSDDETVMVNYRIQGRRGDERRGRRFVVDAVFDKAILIAGVGSSQSRITITRRK
jgi:type IV secretion system protein VirB9